MGEPRRTCLYDSHAGLGARMVDFGGWTMPLQYEGILTEHRRTRTAVSMFDTCHMGEFLAEGPAALDALSALLTADLRSMADGQCRYGFMLNENGGVIDDLITYRFDATTWMLVVNAVTKEADLAWVKARVPPELAVTDRVRRMGKIDVQGPSSPHAMAQVLGAGVSALKRFRFLSTRHRGAPAIVSRTGYTGETGYEIYAAPEAIARVWQDLLDAGVKPAGLGARDTLRLEAGLPLYGHELTDQLSPVEANLIRYAAKSEPYIGREAVERKKRNGIDYRLAGFKVEGRQSARHGNRVAAEGKDAGWVTSGSFSPTLGCAIGMAYVKPRLATPGTRLGLDTGRKALEAEIVELPFYRPSEIAGAARRQ